MRHLQAPLLDMNFYFAEQIDVGYVAVFKALHDLGAIHSGKMGILRGENIRTQPFDGSISTNAVISLSADNIDKWFSDDTIRLVYTTFDNAIGLAQGEMLSYGKISSEASLVDHPPVTITTSGTVFDPIPSLEKDAQMKGRKVYRRFKAIVDKVRPAYAAITFEYHMECPTDLKRQLHSIAFAEFYLDADYIGQENLQEVKKAYQPAYLETIANGLYISTFRANPKGRIMAKHWSSNEAQALIVKIIAQKSNL